MFSVYTNNFVGDKWHLLKCFIRRHVRLMSSNEENSFDHDGVVQVNLSPD